MPEKTINLQAPAKTPQNAIALTCGILSVILCSLFYLGASLGVIAIVFGVKGAKLSGAKTARAGIVLGIIGLVLTCAIYLWFLGKLLMRTY
jgi:hypothetical protein